MEVIQLLLISFYKNIYCSVENVYIPLQFSSLQKPKAFKQHFFCVLIKVPNKLHHFFVFPLDDIFKKVFRRLAKIQIYILFQICKEIVDILTDCLFFAA